MGLHLVFRRWLISFGLLFPSIIVLCGCDRPPDIRTYRAPKPDTPREQEQEAPVSQEYQILGAMFPVDQPLWFFKVQGKTAAIRKYQAEIDSFFASVRFPAGFNSPPEWTLPAGWKQVGKKSKNDLRYATLYFGDHEEGLELAVTPSTGGQDENIRRWARFVGLPSLRNVDQVSEYFDTQSGITGLRVDVKGPADPAKNSPKQEMSP